MKRVIHIALVASLLGAPGIASARTPAAPSEATVERVRQDWKPGTVMIPQDVLMLYPCQNEEMPCGRIAPPPVEQVKFEGPVGGDARRGEAIATNVRYGNCIACHALPGHDGGSIGPNLEEYGARQVSAEYVYQRIWDTRLYNPHAFMPIYGTNKVLTDQEIRDVMAFLGVQ